MIKKIHAKIKKTPLPLTRYKILFSLVLILLLLGLSSVLYRHLHSKEEKPLPLKVQTIRVKEAAMPKVVETVGLLTADKTLTLKAGAQGKVKKQWIESGSWVKAGTLMAEIIAAPDILAPFDGFLTDWQVKEGEWVQAGTPLVDIVNTDKMSLAYKIPEQFASEIKKGQIVEVRVKALSEEVFEGHAHFVSPIIDRKTYTILAKAFLPNPQKALWPGMSAYVRHIFRVNDKALVIPESCLILTLEGHSVLIIEQEKIQKRAIQIGAKRAGRVEVLSGLTLDERVILTRTPMTQEGTPVEPQDWEGAW